MRERRASKAVRLARGATATAVAQFLNSVKLRGRKRLTVRCFAKRGRQYGIVVKHACKRGQRQRTSRLSTEDMLSIAYGPLHKTAPCAAAHGVSPPWVRLMRVVVASAYLQCQAALLGRLVEVSRSRPPLIFLCRIKFDETQQNITTQTVANIIAEQQRGPQHVMVSRMLFRVCWQGAPTLSFELVLPPCAS